MLTITFQTYSKILKKTFTQVETFESMDDFRLWNLALFHGRAKIVKVETN